MTPKEKAKELLEGMRQNTDSVKDAKECALITADELSDFTFPSSTKDDQVLDEWCSDYWDKVRQEIEKL